MKNWYKSKTIWTGITAIVGGLGMYFTGEQTLQELLVSVMGAVFIALRSVTKEGIGK